MTSLRSGGAPAKTTAPATTTASTKADAPTSTKAAAQLDASTSIEPNPDGLRDVELAYRAHGARCYALARQIVRDPDLAQDVVHDVFASLLRTPDRFDPDRGELTPWLLTLTHHKAVDLIRSRVRRTGLDTTDDLLNEVCDPQSGPEDSACRSERATVVRRALGDLAPAERVVIVWAYFGGLSQSEIARQLGLPIGTVKSRTLRGLRHLEVRLGTQWAPG